LTGGGTLLEHWVWEFAELDEHARIELIAEPGDTFDPPDASRMRKVPKPAAWPSKPDAQVQEVERELAQLAQSMHKLRLVKPQHRCGFCGRDEAQVKRLIAGDRVMICDHCIIACHELL
jgi:hypothetical protein